MDSCSTMDSSSSSDCHMSDDEFDWFIVINLGLCRLWHQMLKTAFDAWTMYRVIDSDSD